MIKKKIIRTLCLAVSVLAFAGLTAGQASSEEADAALHESLKLSLKDAVAMGVATNPEYGVVAASRRATDEELKQGKALYLPSVDMRADTGYEYSNDPGTRAFGKKTETLWRSETSLTLTQMLFDGFEAKNEVERQQARVASSANRVRETAELVGLSIVEAYLDVIRQRELLGIARQNVEDHLSILDQIQTGVTGGRSTQADLEQAKARLAAAKATESNTRQALRTAEAKYRSEVGDEAGQLEMPKVPFDLLSPDVSQEVEKTLVFSPTLDIFASDIEVAYAEAQKTKSTMYPQVDLQVNGRTGYDINGVHDRDTSSSALLVMNWNLYRGGADTARSREFIHRHQQAKERRAQAAREVENDVRQTWASMVSAGERTREFTAQADANTEVVKAYREQFTLDRRTLLDVLDAQNELFVSKSNAINTQFLEAFAVYRLLSLKGALFPTMGLPYPAESKVSSGESWSNEEKMDAR